MALLKIRVFLLLSILLTAGFLLWTAAVVHKERSGEGHGETAAVLSENPVEISGLSFYQYESGLLTSKISAEHFHVASRKFGVFSVLPIREAVFDHPKLEIFLHKEASVRGTDLFTFLSDNGKGSEAGWASLLPDDIGLVTRVLLKNLEIHIYKGTSLAVKLSAREGIMNTTKKDFRMNDVSIDDLTRGRQVRGMLAVWNGQERRFSFPRNYSILSSGGEKKGEGLVLDLEFNIESE